MKEATGTAADVPEQTRETRRLMERTSFKPPLHVVWSTRRIDASDPWQRRWYTEQVVTHGRAEDIRQLDWDEVQRLLPSLRLPPHVRALWESYFAGSASAAARG